MQFEALSNALSALQNAKTQLEDLNQRLPTTIPVAAAVVRQETEEELTRNMEIRKFQKDIDDSTMKIEAQIRQLDNIQTLDLTAEYGLNTQAVNSGLSRNMRLLEERKMRAQSMLILEHYMESFRSRKVAGELEAAESWFNIQGRILKAELKSIGVDIGERDVTEDDILTALQNASEPANASDMQLAASATTVAEIALPDMFTEASTFELKNSGAVVSELADKCRAAQEAWQNAALVALQELQRKLNSEISSYNKKIRIAESSISQSHRHASELTAELQAAGVNESGIRQSIEEKFQAVYQKFELYNHQQRSIMRDVEARIDEDVKEVARLRSMIYDLGMYNSGNETTVATSKHIQYIQSCITATENSITTFEAKLAYYEHWMNDLQYALEEVNAEIKTLQAKNRDMFTQNEQLLQHQQSEIAALRYQCGTLTEQLTIQQKTYNDLHSLRAAEIKAAKVKARNSMRLSCNMRLSSRAGQDMIQKARQAREKAQAASPRASPGLPQSASSMGQKLLTAIGEMEDSDEEEEGQNKHVTSSSSLLPELTPNLNAEKSAVPIVPMFSSQAPASTASSATSIVPSLKSTAAGNLTQLEMVQSDPRVPDAEDTFKGSPELDVSNVFRPAPPATPEGMFRTIDAPALDSVEESYPDTFLSPDTCSVTEAAYIFQLHQLAARKDKQKKSKKKAPSTVIRPTFEICEGLSILEQLVETAQETQCLSKAFVSNFSATLRDFKREAPIMRIDESHSRLRDLCVSILQTIITDSPTTLILQNKLCHFSIVAVALVTVLGVLLNCTIEDESLSVPKAVGVFFEDYNHVLLQTILQGGYLDPKKVLDFLHTAIAASRPQLEEVGYKNIISQTIKWKDAVLCGAKLEVADASWKYYSAFSSDNMSILQSEDRHAICAYQQLLYVLATTSIRNIPAVTLPPLDDILQSSSKYMTPYRYISDVLTAALPTALPFLLILELTRKCIEEDINKKTVLAKIALHDEDVAYMQFLNPNEALSKKSSEKIVNEHCIFNTLRPKHKLYINDLKKEVLSLSTNIANVIEQNKTLKLSKSQSDTVLKFTRSAESFLLEVSERNQKNIGDTIEKFQPTIESLRELRFKSLDINGPILQPLLKKKETLSMNLQSMNEKIRTNSIRITTLNEQISQEQRRVTTLAQHTQGLANGSITLVTPELESVLYEIENPDSVIGYEVTRSTAVANFTSQIEYLKDQIAAWKYSYHSLVDRQKRIAEGDLDEADEELLSSVKKMRSKQVGQSIICTLLIMILKHFNDGSMTDQRMNSIVGVILNMVGPPSTDELGYEFLSHYLDAIIAFDGTVMYDGEAFLRAFFSDNMEDYMEMLYRREEAASGKKRLRTQRVVASRQARRLRTVSVEDGADVDALPRMRVASSGGTVQEVIPLGSRQSSRKMSTTPSASKDVSRNNSMRHSPVQVALETSPKPGGKSFLPPLTPGDQEDRRNTKGILRQSVNI